MSTRRRRQTGLLRAEAASALREERGQAAVELAVLMPVAIACALVVVSLGLHVERCARFDRVACDMVLAHGVSPAGEQDAENACAAVRDAIKEAMADDGVEVEVRAERLTGAGSTLFSLAPGRVRFVCTMRSRSRLRGFSFAGVAIGAPAALEHEASIVVDAGQCGVV